MSRDLAGIIVRGFFGDTVGARCDTGAAKSARSWGRRLQFTAISGNQFDSGTLRLLRYVGSPNTTRTVSNVIISVIGCKGDCTKPRDR